jgi:putative lipoic acid-binding regulatory protein
VTDTQPAADETLLKFPCEFPIKAMGRAEADFDSLVVSIVRRHAPDLGEGAVRVRSSRGGQYLAVTVTITATSKRQLDDIYQELSDHQQVLMAL